MPEITVKYENKIIERVVSEKKRMTIGRTNDNDIILENRGVSRRHAVIEINDNAAVIIDNESLNGTFVNNRKITEEFLRDNDVITIGKYCLIFHSDAGRQESASDLDGTMVLKTKRQKEMLEVDRRDRELIAKAGGSLLVGESNTDLSEYQIDQNVTTIGKAKFVHIHAKGFMLSGIQAKIIKEKDQFKIINLGRKGKTMVNGEPIDDQYLKNGDFIQVGKSVYKFVEG